MDNKELFLKSAIKYNKSFSDMTLPCNWITDSKISACFCEKGLCALDYHGNQPVSRNARMIKSGFDNPAFKFTSDIPLSITQYMATSWACEFNLYKKDIKKARIYSFTYESSIYMHIELYDYDRFSVTFDTDSFYTNVHGNISWDKGKEKNNSIVFKGINKYLLSDWLNEKGAYLIPVKEHRRIFKTQDWIDVNNLDILPLPDEDIIRSNELFIDNACYMAIHCNSHIKISKSGNSNIIELTPKISESYIDLCISFADSFEDSISNADYIIRNSKAIENMQFSRYSRFLSSPLSIQTDNHSDTEHLISCIPMYIESAKQKDSSMTRASSSSYYWVWGWDNLVTAFEMNKWNDYEGQKNIISFILEHRWIDGSVPHRYDRNYDVMQTMHFCSEDALMITLAYQYCKDSEDLDFLKKIYPDIKQIWNGLLKKADSKGYIIGPGFYPDNLKALGRHENSRTAMETGTFYTAARIMEQLASLLNDNTIEKQAHDIHTNIEKKYIDDFYNTEHGTIADSINEDGSQNNTFPLYAYMGAYTNFGQILFMKKIEQIATFINQNAIHPMGIRVLPLYDKNRDTESVHHSWYPHWDIYAMKLVRLGFMITKDYKRSSAAVNHYLNLTDRMWKNYKAAMELLELDTADYIEGWKQHGQAWNCNCSSGILRTILESAAGVITDFGTISIIPDACSSVSVKNLWVRKGKWNITHKGNKYFSGITVDGNTYTKTCLVPDEYMTHAEHTLTVSHNSDKDDIKIFSFIGGVIELYEEKENSIAFNAKCNASSDLLVLSPYDFFISINGSTANKEKIANETYRIRLSATAKIEIHIP